MSIPTIYLNDSKKVGVSQELKHACTDVGFFYVEGHGMEPDFLQKVLDTSKKLFDLPLNEKEKLSDKVMSRGYTAMEEETLDPANQTRGDTKEGFYIGRDVPKDDPKYNPAKLTGPNQWPSQEASPSMDDPEGFKRVMEEYFDRASETCLKLVQLLAVAIGLEDEHYFDSHFEEPLAVLRLLHYAPVLSDPNKGVYACGAHSDYGMLTLLLTDHNPGLQILTKSGEWIDVPPQPPALVVNLGDMLERWTNGSFMSTVHRVLTNGDRDRYSIPFFYEPAFDTKVECLEQCCSEENPPKYPPTTSGQHLLDKYAATHADFSPESS